MCVIIGVNYSSVPDPIIQRRAIQGLLPGGRKDESLLIFLLPVIACSLFALTFRHHDSFYFGNDKHEVCKVYHQKDSLGSNRGGCWSFFGFVVWRLRIAWEEI